MDHEATSTPVQLESDTNISPRRRAWTETNLGPESIRAIEKDAQLFLHQSVSTPCLSAIAKAEGIWIEDVEGRRYLDFHSCP